MLFCSSSEWTVAVLVCTILKSCVVKRSLFRTIGMHFCFLSDILSTDHAVGTRTTAFGSFGTTCTWRKSLPFFSPLLLWLYKKLMSLHTQHCSKAKHTARVL